MKPQNQQQIEIVALSKTLPYLTDKQVNWAFENCLEKYAVRSRKTLFCLECGFSWKDESFLITAMDGCTCQNCNNKLKMYQHSATNYKSASYFAVLTVVGEYQVVRMALVSKLMKKNQPAIYSTQEVMQHWVDSKGKIETLSKKVQGLTGYFDSWVQKSDLEIRGKSSGAKLRAGLCPLKIYPIRKISSVIKRNGFKGHFYGHTPHSFFSLLLKENKVETLLKTKQIGLVKEFGNEIHKYWSSIKICIRNNYIVEDVSIWFDYLQLLNYFEKDLNSPKYVCPVDLMKQHDRLLKKKKELLRLLKLIQLRDKIELSQKEFEQQKGFFFGFVIEQGDIQIKVIDSVQGFLEEGDIHDHCVFDNEYYEKKNSLILSASVNKKPAETVEVDLEKFRVKQSRGAKNKKTKNHAEIVNLVKKNMFQIQKIAQKQIA